MATKCIVLGEDPKKGKEIVFKKVLRVGTLEFVGNPCDPMMFGNIELIRREYYESMDLMFAYDTDRRAAGVLYLGHWNDGFVK